MCLVIFSHLYARWKKPLIIFINKASLRLNLTSRGVELWKIENYISWDRVNGRSVRAEVPYRKEVSSSSNRGALSFKVRVLIPRCPRPGERRVFKTNGRIDNLHKVKCTWIQNGTEVCNNKFGQINCPNLVPCSGCRAVCSGRGQECRIGPRGLLDVEFLRSWRQGKVPNPCDSVRENGGDKVCINEPLQRSF